MGKSTEIESRLVALREKEKCVVTTTTTKAFFKGVRGRVMKMF